MDETTTIPTMRIQPETNIVVPEEPQNDEEHHQEIDSVEASPLGSSPPSLSLPHTGPIVVKNAVALHGITADDSVSSILGINKETWMNNFLRLVGIVGLAESIIYIIIVAIAGSSGPQVACIVTGNLCLIVGLALSWGLPHVLHYLIRITAVNLLSLVSLVCAVYAYLELYSVKACAMYVNGVKHDHYNYYGESSYYDDAYTCSQEQTAGGQETCSCVTARGSCFNVVFSTNCQPIVSQVPMLVEIGLAINVVQFAAAILAAIIFYFFVKVSINAPSEPNSPSRSNRYTETPGSEAVVYADVELAAPDQPIPDQPAELPQ